MFRELSAFEQTPIITSIKEKCPWLLLPIMLSEMVLGLKSVIENLQSEGRPSLTYHALQLKVPLTFQSKVWPVK